MSAHLVSCANEVCLWSVNGSISDSVNEPAPQSINLKHVYTRKPHTGPITGAAFNHKGECFYTCSLDGSIVLTDVGTGEAIKTLWDEEPSIQSNNQTNKQALTCLALTQGARWLITGSSTPNQSLSRAINQSTTQPISQSSSQSLNQYCLSLWDIKKLKKVNKPLLGHHAPITAITLSIKQSPILSVATGDKEGKILIHSLNNQNVNEIDQRNQKAIKSLCYMNHSENLVVSGGDDGVVHVWDINQSINQSSNQSNNQSYVYHQFTTRHMHNRPISQVLSSTVNQSIIVSTGFDGLIKQHDLRVRGPVLEIKTDKSINCADFSDDCLVVAIGQSNGAVGLYDLRMNKSNNASNNQCLAYNKDHHKTQVRSIKFAHVKKPISQPINQPVNQSNNQTNNPIGTPLSNASINPSLRDVPNAVVRSSSESSINQSISQSNNESSNQVDFKSPQSSRPLTNPPNSQSSNQSNNQLKTLASRQLINDQMSQLALSANKQSNNQSNNLSPQKQINNPVINPFEPITPYVPHHRSTIANQPINQPVNQSINQPVGQSVSQLVDQSIQRPISRSITPSINQSINQSVIQTSKHSINQSEPSDLIDPSVDNFSHTRSTNHFVGKQPNSQSINQTNNQLIDPSINQSINQLLDARMNELNQSITQSINESINQSISESLKQSINQSINRSINQSMTDFLGTFRADVKNFHFDMIRQFNMQSHELRQEMHKIHQENEHLRNIIDSIHQSINQSINQSQNQSAKQ